MTTNTNPFFVAHLTAALHCGLWDRAAQHFDLPFIFPDDRPLIAKIVDVVFDQYGAARPRAKVLEKFLAKAIKVLPHEPEHRPLNVTVETMTPRWSVPALATPKQLADWLHVPANQLDWFADVNGTTTTADSAKLRHYVNILIPRSGGRTRLLEAPKPKLKAMQRRILREILDNIPPHEAGHGFRAGRSIVTYVEPHVGKRIVMRFDLSDFFASVTRPHVEAIFRAAGYPLAVARLLAGLCTTRTPVEVAPNNRFHTRHLPQGAPTSLALANLAAYRLDLRLTALADKLDAGYTRYADDLAFSGGQNLERAARRFQVLVAEIAGAEGFELNTHKSRFMRHSVRQQLVGVVVNARPNSPREDFDALKAILHNCIRHGPATQNRHGHHDFRGYLRGRIAHVQHVSPERGAKLRVLFERIEWTVDGEG